MLLQPGKAEYKIDFVEWKHIDHNHFRMKIIEFHLNRTNIHNNDNFLINDSNFMMQFC